MTKAQELHIKHLYSTGEDSLDNANNPEGVQDPATITVDEIQTERKQRWRQRSSGEGDEHSTPSTRNYNGNFSNFKNEKQTSQRYNNFQHRDGEGDEHSTPPTRQSGSSDRTTVTKCHPNVVHTNIGKPYAATRPRVHCMAGEAGRGKKKQARE